MTWIGVAIAVAIMLAASWAERRIGPAAAGWVAALPFNLAVTLVVVGLIGDGSDISGLAASAAAHVTGDVTFALAGVAVLRRHGPALGLLAAIGAFAATVALLAVVPEIPAIIAAAAALAIAPLLLPTPEPRLTPPRPRGATGIVLGCAATALAVLAAVEVTDTLGTAAGGAVAAYPMVTTAITLLVSIRDGGRRGAEVLIGLTRSMICYLTFAIVAALTAPTLGPAVVAPAGLAGAAAALFTVRFTRARDRPRWADR